MNIRALVSRKTALDISRRKHRSNQNRLPFVIFMIFSLTFLFCESATSAVEPGSATEAVKKTIDEMLVVLSDKELKKPERSKERLARLLEVIGQRFDYEEMGKRTLAKHWKQLNEAQRKEFVRLFRQFLTNSYAGNVDGYAGEKIEYLKERRKGDFAEVKTRVVSPKLEVPLDYRLLKKNNDWRVYDVVVDGISLMKNYRGQFSRIIKSSSYEGLLEKLRSKTDEGTVLQ